jgi:hypothetical protein
MNQSKLPWPQFRGMWLGMCPGLFIGMLLGVHYHDHLCNSPAASIRWTILAGLGVIAVVPDLMAHTVAEVRRFRAAAKSPWRT